MDQELQNDTHHGTATMTRHDSVGNIIASTEEDDSYDSWVLALNSRPNKDLDASSYLTTDPSGNESSDTGFLVGKQNVENLADSNTLSPADELQVSANHEVGEQLAVQDQQLDSTSIVAQTMANQDFPQPDFPGQQSNPADILTTGEAHNESRPASEPSSTLNSYFPLSPLSESVSPRRHLPVSLQPPVHQASSEDLTAPVAEITQLHVAEEIDPNTHNSPIQHAAYGLGGAASSDAPMPTYHKAPGSSAFAIQSSGPSSNNPHSSGDKVDYDSAGTNTLEECDEATQIRAPQKVEPANEAGFDWGEDVDPDSDWMQPHETSAPLVPEIAEASVTPLVEESLATDLEDSWANALGSPGDNLDESWGAAFGENFDDDGFLEDVPTQGQSAPSGTTVKTWSKTSAYLPQTTPPNPQIQTSTTFTNVTPVGSIPVSSKGAPSVTNFFAELPSSQPPRARRMKSQIINPVSSPPLAPPGNMQSTSVAPSSGAYQMTAVGSRPGPLPFRGPERLDLFPPEPSVAPRSSSYNAIPQGSGLVPGPATRYSPAPATQANSQTIARSASQSSRYSPAPAAVPVTSHSLPQRQTEHATEPQDALASVQARSKMGSGSAASATSRYSPAPAAAVVPPHPYIEAGQSSGPPPRHASYAPTSNGPPPSKSYAPRTSSPLAQFQQPSDVSPSMSPRRRQSEAYQPNHDLSSTQLSPKRGSLSSLQNIPEGSSFSHRAIPPRTVSYQPSTTSVNDLPDAATPPYVSNHDESKSRTASLSSQPTYQSQTKPSLDFIIPGDETGADPLQRWKGCPIISWGPGGHVLSTFPKHIPRYGVGLSQPLLKCIPGAVNLRSLKSILPIEDTVISFPGPLKSKNKKKEVLAWLSTHINALETERQSTNGTGASTHHLRQIPDEERAILWKVMRVLVENDGVLHGNPVVEAAVRNAISASTGIGHEQSGWPADSSSSLNAQSATDTADPAILAQIRESLLAGNRETAVWQAVDNNLWGHAMLLSSTLEASVWRQVCQEFVRKEIQGPQPGSKPLATLYEIFAGNREDSIDQLVPPSARAGFQMVSAAQTPSRNINATSGLDQWRETLGLILSNRTADDEKAMCALGHLLSQYGRIEAAHICFLFCRSVSRFGGADDPHSNFTLVGADLAKPSFEAIKDLDAILLSEVYEFALSLSPSSSPQYIPHLQAYKLSHTFALVEYGHRSEAQQYCETLSSAMKASTKVSPYYHHSLLSQVEELHKRLSQSPKDGASSWMSKAFNEKTRGGLLAKFNNFIDPGDTDTPHGKENDNEYGPFANLAGGSPPIVSRSGSNTDLYGAYPGAGSAPLPASTNLRYPSSSYASKPSQEPLDGYSPYGSYASSSYTPEIPHSQQAARSPYDLSGSSPYSHADGRYSPMPPQPLAQRPISGTPAGHPAEQEARSSSSSEPYMPSVPTDTFAGVPSVTANPLSNEASYGLESKPALSHHHSPALISGQNIHSSSPNGFVGGSGEFQPISAYDSSATNAGSLDDSMEPSTSNFQPLSNTYQPPSYQPYMPEETVDEPSANGRKKPSMFEEDNDDDIAKKAQDLKRQEKAQRDKEADDAVKRAAEADSARDLQRKSSGWLGGWFGKKDSSEPTVYKAKLGEESSFYYDPDLKKWVNKKAGDAMSAITSAGTPPPPRAAPRIGSNTSLPPSSLSNAPTGTSPPPGTPPGMVNDLVTQANPAMPPSRTTTPNGSVGGLAASGKIPPVGSTTSAPPSRPSTGMSNASSIDDLLGAPQPRKAGAARSKKKGGRYVDVMAK